MNIHFQSRLMIFIRFRKRKRSADKAPQPLSQCVIPSFNMGCFARLFSHRLMFLAQQAKHLFVGFPEVAESDTVPISKWYPRPQTPTAFFTAVTNEVGNNLACATAQSYPNPSFVFLTRQTTKAHPIPAHHRAGPLPMGAYQATNQPFP